MSRQTTHQQCRNQSDAPCRKPSRGTIRPASCGQCRLEQWANRGEKAEELSKRVDELAKHLADDGAKDSTKHVEDLDKYLRELSEKGELTQAGRRCITTALQTVQELTAEG